MEEHLEYTEEIPQPLVKKKRAYPVTWGGFIGFFGAYLGFIILFSLLTGMFYALAAVIFGFSMAGFEKSPVFLLIDALTFTAVMLVFKRTRQFMFQKLTLGALKKKKTYFLMAWALIICQVSQYLIFEVLHLEDPGSNGDDRLFTSEIGIAGIFIVIFCACIAAPVTEELVFRGFLFRFFHERYHFIAGLVVSSAVFGSLHIGYPLAAGIMGIVFAMLFYFTKSLVPGMLVHALWNTYVSIVELLS
ncbi:CPBP family intramembrane glutamic endopeptidase [Fictibacillus sp. FJAT-27399]|uniref:CPBP family intramembrane glutamic endopeptidase n=1 Tax=Fictibacillus sp. FJAT-27399 TaxID=1729689 RepID=UPI0007812A96|nr:type II CAAX endopeptidase family protein [Fictibacillus sp. FJAT-27399]